MIGNRILRDLGPGLGEAQRELLIWLRRGMFPHARPIPGPSVAGGCAICGHLDVGNARQGHGCIYGCCVPECNFGQGVES